jgi:hypothetical protein
LSLLLDGLEINKGHFTKLLGIKSRGTVYTWLAAPDDGGVPIPGSVWLWVQLLTERPEMIDWLERKRRKETEDQPSHSKKGTDGQKKSGGM